MMSGSRKRSLFHQGATLPPVLVALLMVLNPAGHSRGAPTGAAAWALDGSTLTQEPSGPDSHEPAAPQPPPDAAQPEREPAATGLLPWRRGDQPPALTQPEGARQWFEVGGMDPSQWRAFRDGAVWGREFQEPLAKVLFRLPQIDVLDLDRWSRQGPSQEQLQSAPENHRLDVVSLRGDVVALHRRSFMGELAERYSLTDYFEVEMQLAGGQRALICTPHAPAAWSQTTQLREPAELEGLFLQTARLHEESDATTLVLAAQRIRWRPTTAEPALGVTPSQVALAQLGLDVGRLDDIRDRNRRSLNETDRECFYQMLAAAQQGGNAGVPGLQAVGLDLSDLMQRPQSLHGEFVTFVFNVRRVTRVIVNDADIQQRLGIDNYFQVDGFVPLGEMTIRLGGDPTAEPAVFTNRFPASLCIVDLPASLRQAAYDIVAGNSQTSVLNVETVAQAFFFKIWSYKTEYVERFSPRQLQISPMFMGVSLAPRQTAALTNPWLGLAAGGLFLLALAAICLALWKTGSQDARRRRPLPDTIKPPQPPART